MGLIISTEALSSRLDEPGLVVADVRWNPAGTPSGEELFAAGHIAGAAFVDLDTDLSDRSDLSLGRHPLPSAEDFASAMARLGIGRGSFVVCCDEMSGAIASRLWWMLRHWLGHTNVAVLNGGFGAWRAEGRAIETGAMTAREPAGERLNAEARADAWVDRAGVQAHLASGGVLLDARGPERYRGEVEPLDAKPGHIPGATNRPIGQNLKPEGAVFKEPGTLRREFDAHADESVVSSCGSGVTACQNILSFERAGLTAPRLYVGSFSEWSQHEPVATGER